MGFISPTALPCSFTLFKAFSASKSMLLGSRLLLIFVVWAAFLGGGLVLAVISCIFALCHLCQLAVVSLSHTSHTAFLIHLHPAAARWVSAVYECVCFGVCKVCTCTNPCITIFMIDPLSVNFNANGKGSWWLWQTSRQLNYLHEMCLIVCVCVSILLPDCNTAWTSDLHEPVSYGLSSIWMHGWWKMDGMMCWWVCG